MNVFLGCIIQHDGLWVGHPCRTGCNHSDMLSAELAGAKRCYFTCVCCWQLKVPLDVKIKFSDSCVLNCIEIDCQAWIFKWLQLAWCEMRLFFYLHSQT